MFSVTVQPFPHLCPSPLELVRLESGTLVWDSGCTEMSLWWPGIWKPVLTGTGPVHVEPWYLISTKHNHSLNPLYIQWCTLSSRRLLISADAVLKLRSGERAKTLLHSLGSVCSGKWEKLSVLHSCSTCTGEADMSTVHYQASEAQYAAAWH